ncbi:hypothetical protein GCM10009645_54310 [Mycolicibacterium poriferae]|uniref:Luciferase-like domain-containing protein n=1 Tax=Mycolicibacterium poriferae TaxID=39694 RepID=A0A6N4VF98_9MYCO|nr:hypothetical protein [Mycolicibacterium poriferae]MAS04715.1 hypothetical protein [Ahrensia sp.]MCV7262628.1 hypothetical protein [Mycolicibacterium poriferae]BBX53119.1 hypothetical protein MPOR_41450 [Mycolicibacterium poriferae]
MHYDVAVPDPVRVIVADSVGVAVDAAGEFVRVRGEDLRLVAQRANAARTEHPGRTVLVDIDVVVDDTAAGARRQVADAGVSAAAGTLTYIGTPTGLAGLIADIHALGLCDGAVLRPLLPGVAEVIRARVLPELDTMGLTAPRESWPA